MSPDAYLRLKERVGATEYAEEISWAEGLRPVEDSWTFFTEYVWVVVNAGMKNQVARKIYDRLMKEINRGGSVRDAFGHEGKCSAILKTFANLTRIFTWYRSLKSDPERIEYLQTLSWIGPITKYHLAKNLGITTVAKPDRHLVRIAGLREMTAQELCEEISRVTGDTVAVVDLVIWRAANLGMV